MAANSGLMVLKRSPVEIRQAVALLTFNDLAKASLVVFVFFIHCRIMVKPHLMKHFKFHIMKQFASKADFQ